jgi:hypothetical protein
MARTAPSIAVCGALLLSGCVALPPTGPSVMALPTKDKDFAAFQQDDVGCRQYASQVIGVEPADAAQASAVNSAALGTLLGAAAGAAIGAAAGNAGAGAAIGAGSGLLFGGLAGADAGAVSGATVQRRYDHAYLQCMASKGNSVPVAQAPPQPVPQGPVAVYPAYPPPPPGYYYYPYPAYAYPPPPVHFGFGYRRHYWR